MSRTIQLQTSPTAMKEDYTLYKDIILEVEVNNIKEVREITGGYQYWFNKPVYYKNTPKLPYHVWDSITEPWWIIEGKKFDDRLENMLYSDSEE